MRRSRVDNQKVLAASPSLKRSLIPNADHSQKENQ
jgi:hypothetical protein